MRRLAFPGEELHVSGAIPVRTVITALSAVPAHPVIPAFPPSFLPFHRHSCEGRNLNQVMGVFELHFALIHIKDFRAHNSTHFVDEKCLDGIPAQLTTTARPS